MDRAPDRVGVLVLRVTAGAGPEGPCQILVSTVDRLPPHGEPAHPEHRRPETVEEAVAAVRGWLEQVAGAP